MGMDGAVGLDWSVTVVLSARWGTMSNESPSPNPWHTTISPTKPESVGQGGCSALDGS